MVEFLFCNQRDAGSIPATSFAEMPEGLKGVDCKSTDVNLRRFESFSLHYIYAEIAQW